MKLKYLFSERKLGWDLKEEGEKLGVERGGRQSHWEVRGGDTRTISCVFFINNTGYWDMLISCQGSYTSSLIVTHARRSKCINDVVFS